MSVYVVRAFIQMREQLAANREILKRLAEIDETLPEPGLRATEYLSETVAALAATTRAAKTAHRLWPGRQIMIALLDFGFTAHRSLLTAHCSLKCYLLFTTHDLLSGRSLPRARFLQHRVSRPFLKTGGVAP